MRSEPSKFCYLFSEWIVARVVGKESQEPSHNHLNKTNKMNVPSRPELNNFKTIASTKDLVKYEILYGKSKSKIPSCLKLERADSK